MAAHTHLSPINSYHLVWSIMLHHLLNGEHSRDQLAEATGVQPDTMGYMIRALRRKQSRSIYVSGWARDHIGRWTTKLYRLGDKPDVPKPPPEQRASPEFRAKAKAWRDKRRAEKLALAKLVAERAAKVDDPTYLKRVQIIRSRLKGEA